MALSGTHITCGYSGPYGGSHGNTSLLGRTIWSQTMPTAGTTTNTAPAISDSEREPIYSIISSLDIFFALGTAPNAVSGTRRFLQANTPIDVFAEPSDKLAWVAA